MRIIVDQADPAMVRFDDGLTQRKTQSKSPTPIDDRILSGIEHFKDVLLRIVRDPRAVIADRHDGLSIDLFTADHDL